MNHHHALPSIQEESAETAVVPWSAFDESDLRRAFRAMDLRPGQLMTGMSPSQVSSLRRCGEETAAGLGFYCRGEIDVDLRGLKSAFRRFAFDLLLGRRDLRTLRVNLSYYDNPSLEVEDEGEGEIGDDEVFVEESMTSYYSHGPLRTNGGGVSGLRRTFSELNVDVNLLPE